MVHYIVPAPAWGEIYFGIKFSSLQIHRIPYFYMLLQVRPGFIQHDKSSTVGYMHMCKITPLNVVL